MSACPECQSPVTLEDGAVEGEILVCGECSAELELLALEPVELAPAPELAEDWGE